MPRNLTAYESETLQLMQQQGLGTLRLWAARYWQQEQYFRPDKRVLLTQSLRDRIEICNQIAMGDLPAPSASWQRLQQEAEAKAAALKHDPVQSEDG
jgi:hypothetical protein